MPVEWKEFVQSQVDLIVASAWIHQLALLLVSLAVAWPISVWAQRLLDRGGRLDPERPREERIPWLIVDASIWPTAGLGITAVALQVAESFGYSSFGTSERILPVAGFFLLFRLVDRMLREFVAEGYRRRRLRKGAVPAIFVTAVLQQLGLIGPLIDWMQQPLVTIGGVPITLFSVLMSVVVILGAALVGRVIFTIIGHRFLPSFGIDIGLSEAIGTVVRYTLVVVGFVWALEILGFDLTTVKIAFGALGVGIGFGLQTIVNNFVSGLILLFERSVKRGDILTVEGTDARVQSIGLRASVVRNRQGDDLIMPNSILASSTVTNYSYRDRLKRVDVNVGVSYSADPNQLRELLLEVARDCDEVMQHPTSSVLFMGYGSSSIDFQLRVWINDAWRLPMVRSRLLFDIWYKLKDNGIEIPFPQRDLHLRSGELPVRRLEGEA